MRYLALLSLIAITSFVSAQDGPSMVADQWSAADENGSIDAVVVSPNPVIADGRIRVSLGAVNGAIYRAQPRDEAGINVSFAAIPSGVYTLTVRGPGVAACYAVHVVGGVSDETAEAEHFVEISAANLSMDVVSDLVTRYAPGDVASGVAFDDAEARDLLDSLAAHSMQVSQTGGGLSGTISSAGVQGGEIIGAGMTNVTILQNGQVVAQTVTDADGNFRVESLPPGKYAMVAAGAQGIAVVGFGLTAEELPAPNLSASNSNRSGETLVALQNGGSGMNVQLAPSGLNSEVIQDWLQSAPPEVLAGIAPAPMPAGGGFGGAAGGAGGGMGGVAALAGLGIGLAALAKDDDDGIQIPPAVSPLNP